MFYMGAALEVSLHESSTWCMSMQLPRNFVGTSRYCLRGFNCFRMKFGFYFVDVRAVVDSHTELFSSTFVSSSSKLSDWCVLLELDYLLV